MLRSYTVRLHVEVIDWALPASDVAVPRALHMQVFANDADEAGRLVGTAIEQMANHRGSLERLTEAVADHDVETNGVAVNAVSDAQPEGVDP